MKITYEVSKDLEKIYEDGVWHLLKFNYKIILTELTLENRVLLGLPTMDSNEVKFTDKALTDAIIYDAKTIPAMGKETEIKELIMGKIAHEIIQLESKLTVHNEKISVTTDNFFKETI